MTINLINSSIISSIAAIDFSKSLRSDIYLKPGELLDFNRYFSINEFSKIYLDNLGIWNQLDKDHLVVRFVTSFETTKCQIDKIIERLKTFFDYIP